MDGLKVLGAYGGRMGNGIAPTCLQVSKHIIIDAGNILEALGEEALHVDHIFLTHSHLDHFVDGAFLVDNFFAKRTKPLRFYGLIETLDAIKKHIFNWKIWPDFSSLELVHAKEPAVEFVVIEPNVAYEIGEYTITPIMANHTVPCCGYEVKKGQSGLFFSGDTANHDGLWEYLNRALHVKAFIVDVSFPNALSSVAINSKHFHPQMLVEGFEKLKRSDLLCYIYHLKPSYVEKIKEELSSLNIAGVLCGQELISYESGKCIFLGGNKNDKIKSLNRIGAALSAQSNIDALLEMIVEEAKNITQADAGTLYLLNENALEFKVVQTDSLGIRMGGLSSPITWPPLALYKEDGSPNNAMVAALCALKGKAISIPDVYTAEDFNFEGTRRFDSTTGYRSCSMLVLPLKNHEHKIIGVLQLLNKKGIDSWIPFSEDDTQIALSLASQAAIALTNAILIEDLERLLEAFLRSIIYAIKMKSPYTAGHIERMVSLANMFAQAVHDDGDAFKEKTFTKEELKQLNFAALMHDIGKLATPEYVMDKATKLDGIFDQIELIKERFNSASLACEIAFLKNEITAKEYEAKLLYCKETLSFLEQINKGAEFVPDEQVEKISQLSSKSFVVGSKSFILLSKKEAYALSVQKGTLTKEERDIINDHAQITLDILKQLPFPEKYKEVPQISANHHEKINGKGYPCGLKDEEISFEARILAIADIFEALTASDRPYKKANRLSASMKILYFMAKDGEIDKELVKFFYSSGLYMQYANKYLPQSLIDTVEIDFNSL